jgi:hypothetical protein
MILSVDSFRKVLPIGLSLAISMTFLAPKARSEYACGMAGPGEIVVGSTQASPGVGSVLLCDRDPNYQEEGTALPPFW